MFRMFFMAGNESFRGHDWCCEISAENKIDLARHRTTRYLPCTASWDRVSDRAFKKHCSVILTGSVF